MNSVTPAVMGNHGNRILTFKGNGRKRELGLRARTGFSSSRVTLFTLPAGRDAKQPVLATQLPKESYRFVNGQGQITDVWLSAHFNVPQETVTAALDMVLSWGVQIRKEGDVIWLDRRLFNQLLFHKTLAAYFKPEDKMLVHSLLEPKR